ncbi:MAG: hypothetical protein IJB74_09350 [Clostridia bacterium]|nr:hypothetical protein [Clostridia bacterium]
MEHAKKKSPLNFIVGLIVIVLTVIGFISVIDSVSDKIQRTANKAKQEQIQLYEDFISPVIMNDPDTFDDITKANLQQLLSIAIWSVIDDGAEPEMYEYTDGGMLMPQKDVENEFVSLFGTEIAISHGTVDGGDGVTFKYSKKKQCYIIPITGIMPIYLPEVTEVDEKDSSVVLTVGYLASADWVKDSEGNMVPPEPGKYMKITLGKNGDGSFFVKAIQNID